MYVCFKSLTFLFLYKFSPEDMCIDFRERGRGKGGERKEGERNISVREKHLSVASHMSPNQEWNPQPKYMP